MNPSAKVIALSGGIGGAKLALGLYQILAKDELMVICNTGDDFVHLGFSISPDIDTVIYTLAGVNNQDTGWGRAGETWNFMQAWEQLGGETWFNLGDKDLATHVLRSQGLKAGETLSNICDVLTEQFKIHARVLPASDNSVQTLVLTPAGPMSFQHYFVRDQCKPRVTGFEFVGAAEAKPVAGLLEALASDRLEAIVICPSNPLISIDPILAVPGLRRALQASPAAVVAVSPIIGGAAVKGPTAKMMMELGLSVSAAGVAAYYGELLDGYVVDTLDAGIADELNLPVTATKTLMRTNNDKPYIPHPISAQIGNFSRKIATLSCH